jgi:hypothetical protein
MLSEAIHPTASSSEELSRLEKLVKLMGMARQSIDEGRPLFSCPTDF